MWWNGPGSGMMSYGWGWMPFHGIFSLAFLALVIGAVIMLLRFMAGGTNRPSFRKGRSSALDVLEKRYARGEIDRDEYLRKKHDITDHGAVA